VFGEFDKGKKIKMLKFEASRGTSITLQWHLDELLRILKKLL